MYTVMGDQIVYENIRLGCTKEEGDEEQVFLAFTDVDNEKTHLVPLAVNKANDYIQLIQKVTAGAQIIQATAGDMPK